MDLVRMSAVMDVRIAWMLVGQGFVLMQMRVRLQAVPRGVMPVLVMLVVAVAMGVLYQLVRMLVLMPLSQVNPYA